MTQHVYVGNLPHDTTSETLRSAFEKDGRSVASVALVRDHRTGRSRGFGFVEMESEEAAEAVIRELDGTELGGRTLRVKEGKERPEFQVRSDPDAGRRGGNRRRRR
jgi:RNA recognition motif-containing protein